MQALVSLLFAPWWLFMILAGGVFWAGDFLHENTLERNAALLAAVEEPLQPAVDLSSFSYKDDLTPVDEVHVSGWIDTEANYHLTKTKSGVVKDERFMYLLFGTADIRTADTPQSSDAPVVRAILMLTVAEKEEFIENFVEFVDFDAPATGNEIGYKFNGFASKSDSFDEMAEDAIAELGYVTSPDVFYLSPFLDGREAGLAPRNSPEEVQGVARILAMGLAGFGLFKFLFGALQKKRKTSRAMSQSAADQFAYSPIQTSGRQNIGQRKPLDGAHFGQLGHQRDEVQQSFRSMPGTDPGTYSPLAQIQRRSAVAPQVAQPTATRAKAEVTGARSKALSPKSIKTLLVLGGIILLVYMPYLMPLAVLGLLYIGFATFMGSASGALGGLFNELRGNSVSAKADPFDRLK